MFLIDNPPKYCPNCGEKFKGFINKDKYALQDFYAGCEHRCQSCGLTYRYCKRSYLDWVIRTNYQEVS